MARRRCAAWAALLWGVAAVAAPRASRADPVADFYHGKTVHLVVGAAVAGGYDLVGRAVAARIGAYIPGHPSVVVDNMPTASGLLMANYLYNTAPQDGTEIGMPPTALALEPRLKLLTREGGSAKFDIGRFHWLGTAARLPQVLFVWRTTDVRTAADLKGGTLLAGALAAGTDSAILPVVLNNMLGARLRVVSGYAGHSDMFGALERGEVQAYSDSYTGLMANRPDWVREGLVRIVVQFGRNRLPQLPQVPTAVELAPDALDTAALRFFSYKYDLADAFIAAPGTPADRVKALRTAFDETMSDPAYLKIAKSLKLPDNPLDGAAVTKVIAAIQAAPQDVVDRMKALMVAKPTN